MKVLVVGAGFAGAVYARTLAEHGHSVVVVDKRDHVGGNAFDYIDERGVRVHKYGPHLFHTNNLEVVNWVKRFGEWCEYFHQVRALLPDNRLVPMPVNCTTVESVFGVKLSDEADCRAFLATRAVSLPAIRNAADHLYSTIGRELTELFFRPYNKKMWNLDLEDIDVSVVARVPLRFDRQTLYFANDRFQIMPVEGYAALFDRIFSHPNIRLELGVGFDKDMEASFGHIFNSMPIDEYFGYCYGELPYRSIRFHHSAEHETPADVTSVVNFTDRSAFTRLTRWHLLPHHSRENARQKTVTREEPCDYKDNNHERYYPVKTSDDRYVNLYQEYKLKATETSRMTFVGRCGTYQYLDMHQVINQSLSGAHRWLASNH